jgi:hypothetical protein
MKMDGLKEPKSSESKIKRSKMNFLVDCLLIVFGILMIFSGLLLQARYHGRTMDPLVVTQIPDYIHWTQIHKLSIVIVSILVCFHIPFHIKWYRSVIKKGLIHKNKLTISLTIVFSLSAMTGFWAWLIPVFYKGASGLIAEKHIIEIHDKLSIILAVLIIVHVSKKVKWLVMNGKKYFQVSKAPEASHQRE